MAANQHYDRTVLWIGLAVMFACLGIGGCTMMAAFGFAAEKEASTISPTMEALDEKIDILIERVDKIELEQIKQTAKQEEDYK